MPPRSAAEWKALDKRSIWHPFTQMRDWLSSDPLIVDRAESFELIDVDGRRYLDGHSSLWVNIHGHSHPRLVRAIAEQAAKLDHSTLLGLGNTPSIELAERLLQLAPPGLSRVFYSDSGSTAMEIAVKMALQYWQEQGQPARQRFISFGGAYHGDTLGSVSVGGIDVFHRRFRPLLFQAIFAPWPRPYRDPQYPGDPDRVRDRCLEALERLLTVYRGEVAAIVCEAGVQAADGMHVAPPGWMAGVQELARRHDILLVVDEVATGFCRTGKLFACEHEGIEPDLMAVAKGITGGTLPLAATLVNDRIYEAFLGDYHELKHFFHGHTYTGNPIACAAALANLDLIAESNLVAQLPGKAEVLAAALKPLAAHPHVGDIRRFGLMVGIEIVADRSSKEPFPLEWQVPQRITQAVRQHGAVIRPLGPVLVLMPPPAMPDALIRELVERTAAGMADVLRDPEPV